MTEPSSQICRGLRFCGGLATILTSVCIGLGVLWAFGALWFDFPHDALRKGVAVAFAVGALAVALWVKPRWRARLGLVLAVVLVLIWWSSLQPRQFRDWKPEVSVPPHAVVEGNHVTIHGVRNFDYRTEKDFIVRHETREYDLENLRAVDVFINYWGSPYMAHPIVSFDFGPQGRVCFSIETRPEKGETYSALGGLYRQFELFYVVADERDAVRVRSNFRVGEDVYLYRLNARAAKLSFMEYMRTINELHAAPRWYNAITNNCTTAIRHQRASSTRTTWDWRMLVNGFGDELLYERGAINRDLPFAELKKISRINGRADAADPDFSETIRKGLPGMSSVPKP